MKYRKSVENAKKPEGFRGRLMIRSMNKNHSELTDWALKYLSFRRSDYVLDIGCGGGRTVSKLCSKIGNGKVYGIDYSELCVKKSSKLNHKNILCGKAKIIHSSVSELPFGNDFFDIITSVESYYFWPDKLNDLIEIKRTLKSGGELLLVFEMLRTEDDPNKWDEVEKAANIKAVSENEIYDILIRAGFENIRTHIAGDSGWLCAVAEKE